MEKLAIIGSGISGLGCAWFLHRNYEVTVFEADSRIGGHSHTISIEEGDSEVRLDTGFMVYNEVTYPHLTRLFRELNVPTKPTSMSFSVQHGPSGVEWNGGGFNTLFGQRRNLFSIRHWRFLSQLNRFNKEAIAALDDPQWQSTTLAEYVEQRGYGQDFLERYLVPMSSAVWSTPPVKMLEFPAIALLRFWYNHGFLGLDTQHPWRTVEGGSREYVERITEPFRDRICTETPVKQITRNGSGVEIVTEKRGAEIFDKVILAAHAPTNLRLLVDPTPQEKEILEAFSYQPNDVLVHSDNGVMPKTKRCRASWNYRTNSAGIATTHYWMNNLQGVSDRQNYYVSLNSNEMISKSEVHRELAYDHPLFNLKAMAAQKRVPELNLPTSEKRTFFAGAWTRYGFHEDGLLSAVNVCENLLGGDPWELR